MKTLTVIECRACGVYLHGSDQKTVIHPWEQINWVMKKIPKCSTCKDAADRTTRGRKRPIRPNDY